MTNLRDLTIEELTEFLKSMEESSYRGKQLFKWIHCGVESFSECTDLSKTLREKLQKESEITLPKVYRALTSKLDGTVKLLFELNDKNLVESVVMSYRHGYSICISSQVGCRMGCTFCASTLNGLTRNLLPGEIEGQIIAAQKHLGIRISNIVVMGIGEPLDNYVNIVKFLKNVNEPLGLGIGWRHITISTCGLVPEIIRLAKEDMPVNLALSLHAPNDVLRQKMMPVAKAYSIAQIMSACDFYFEQTGRRITFEYALSDTNDSPECAAELVKLLKGRNCHVNLIPINPVKERSYVRSSRERVIMFMDHLNKNGINATMRRELGSDISASCGQLRNAEISG